MSTVLELLGKGTKLLAKIGVLPIFANKLIHSEKKSVTLLA
jgi:hypothetical protein